MYFCPQCNKRFATKTDKTFYRNSKSSDGFHSWCKKCVKEYNRGHRKELSEEKKHRKLLNLAADKIKCHATKNNLPPSWSAERFKELMGMTIIELAEIVDSRKYK